MLRRLYDWVIRLAAHPRALPALGIISFLESSVFPIPPDVMLVPMVLANRAKAFRIALVCTITSVLGGLLGYAIGYYFFETIGDWVVQTYGLQSGLAAFRAGFEQYGVAPADEQSDQREECGPGSCVHRSLLFAHVCESCGDFSFGGPAAGQFLDDQRSGVFRHRTDVLHG